MSKKKAVLARVFEDCIKKGETVFHNSYVKKVSEEMGFGNQYDATKLDRLAKYPDIINQKGYFLIHLGKGYHRFVPNQSLGYHQFEPINEGELMPWEYVPGVLNDFDTSEANILSIAYNQSVLHDFVYGDRRANPQVYLARRTKFTGSYMIAEDTIDATQVQMEMDLVLELNGNVTVFEAKNGFHDDFAVYQLFHPYLYFDDHRRSGKLNLGDIQCCYLQRKKTRRRKNQQQSSVLRLHLYRFRDREMASIELLRKREYELKMKDPL
ncbi:MAG: hypothetical protein OXQ99_17180 [Chloroflexota bacterium]|nr:hypothetical protein [Chloroflexota bacterium]